MKNRWAESVRSSIVREGSPVGASRLWWKRFVEKVSFEPGMEQWMCDGGWEWWAGGRWITECDIIQESDLCKADLMSQEVDSREWRDA